MAATDKLDPAALPAWTKGPWRVTSEPAPTRGNYRMIASDQPNRGRLAHVLGLYVPSRGEEAANANLIASAPDHADIGWAMCVAAGRWEPWGDGRGEFCINGMRYATELDPFGIPSVTPPLREAINRARGQQS